LFNPVFNIASMSCAVNERLVGLVVSDRTYFVNEFAIMKPKCRGTWEKYCYTGYYRS